MLKFQYNNDLMLVATLKIGPDYRVVTRKFRNGTMESDLLFVHRGVDERSRLPWLVS